MKAEHLLDVAKWSLLMQHCLAQGAALCSLLASTMQR